VINGSTDNGLIKGGNCAQLWEKIKYLEARVRRAGIVATGTEGGIAATRI
jgi:hypothetical protein